MLLEMFFKKPLQDPLLFFERFSRTALKASVVTSFLKPFLTFPFPRLVCLEYIISLTCLSLRIGLEELKEGLTSPLIPKPYTALICQYALTDCKVSGAAEHMECGRRQGG